MSRLLLTVPIAAAAVLSPLACRRASSIDPTRFRVEYESGVRWIHNRAPQRGDSSALRLEFIGKIGELEGRAGQELRIRA